MNDTLRSGLMNDRNGFNKLISSLVRRIAGDFVPDFLDSFLRPCLISLVSQSLDFVLSGPLEG